jgi:DNA-binding beta-propeller fold protein YncE
VQLRDHYDGSGDPFEGDRTIAWRSLPAHAVVTKATLTLEPKMPPGKSGYIETLRFSTAGPSYGATIRKDGTAAEIDFHARRTAVQFAGLSSAGTATGLAADIGGGVYLSVAADGTIPRGSGSAYAFSGNALPGIGALRLRLDGLGPPGNASPDDLFAATTLDIRSLPSNLTLRFGKLPPFWSKTGELGSATTTPDLVNAVQRALTDAAVENGFHVVPLVVHSDTLGRLAVSIEVEYLGAAPVIPSGLREVLLPYDYSGVAKNGARTLTANLPAGAKILSPQTSLQVRGAFEASRIAHDATGLTDSSKDIDCSAKETLAQRIVPTNDTNVSAIDLLLAADDAAAARLALDLRADADGKPSETSLLAKPAAFDLAGSADGQPHWTSVPIAPAAQLTANCPYWVIVQALDDATAKLRVTPASDRAFFIQRSTDAGFSWRVAGLSSQLLLRLRTVPDRFEMPIDFVAGTDASRQRASLDAYAALGKVDMVIDRPEVAAALQTYVDKAVSAPCATGERLQNPNFEQWTTTGNGFGSALAITADKGWSMIVDTFRDESIAALPSSLQGLTCLAFSPDGTTLYVGTPGQDLQDSRVRSLDPSSFSPRGPDYQAAALALAPSADGRTLYILTQNSLIALDLATNTAPHSFALTGAKSLALAPDGGSAYVADQAAIVVFDLATGLARYSIPVAASMLALSSDGALLVAIDDQGRVAAFNAANGGASWTASMPQNLPARAVAFAADGNSVYAAGAFNPQTVIVPLAAFDPRGNVIQTIPKASAAAPAAPVTTNVKITLAVKPQGDRIYVAVSPLAVDPAGDRLLVAGSSVIAVPVGTRQPVAWTLTAGTVKPFLDNPKRIAAELAEGALSQVVAVAPTCFHRLSVDAMVTGDALGHGGGPAVETHEPADAVAEVFWLDAAGTLLRTDSLPLPPSRLFVPQDLRLTPPATSAQAEVRARVAGGRCRLRSVSLQTTDALLQDDAWKPAASASIASTRGATGTTYRNLITTDAAVAQTIVVDAGSAYELDLRGVAIANSAGTSPYLDIQYLDQAGAPVGTPDRVALGAVGFARHPASLNAPKGATSAQVRIVMPAGGGISVEQLQILPQRMAEVPVGFIAQSPGELHVSNGQIVYDWKALAPPAPPAGGLNPPTPPDYKPGDPECCECEPSTSAASAGKPAILPAPLAPTATATAIDAPLTAVNGIGAARAERLTAAGIRSARDLAAAYPAHVTAALTGTGPVTPTLVANLIKNANALLAGAPNGGAHE